MTTKQQPTPYDAEIERLDAGPIQGLNLLETLALRDAYEFRREGYLRARAEDADLLAACLKAIDTLEFAYQDQRGDFRAGDWLLVDVQEAVMLLRAAIVRADGVGRNEHLQAL